MGGPLIPPWVPTFGNGAPGAGVPTSSEYFDTGTTPFTPYVYHAGAWHASGAGGGGGAAPTVVQFVAGAGGVSTLNLPGAPTQGNILLAMFAHFSNNIPPSNPAAGAGWANYEQVNGGVTDGFGLFYKIVGPGETAAQTPTTSNFDAVVIYEVAGGKGFDAVAGTHDASATPTIVQAITTTQNNCLLLFMCSNVSAAINSIAVGGGVTQDVQATGGSHAVTGASGPAVATGTFNPSATYAANPTPIACMAVSVNG